jgi:hypothetical protein
MKTRETSDLAQNRGERICAKPCNQSVVVRARCGGSGVKQQSGGPKAARVAGAKEIDKKQSPLSHGPILPNEDALIPALLAPEALPSHPPVPAVASPLQFLRIEPAPSPW